MTVKDELQAAVEDLDDRQAEQILAVIRRLRAIARWDEMPADDEEETDAERAGVAAAKTELAAGQGIAWDRVKRGQGR